MKTFRIVTLGCRTNQYETEALRQQFITVGMEPAQEDELADLCIINTCAVTEQAEVSSRHAIRSIISQNTDACVVVTGCLAQKEQEVLLGIQGVTHVIGNEEKERICEILFPEIPPPLFAIKEFSGHTRAFVKIQDGCNHFCAYCTVPFLRGRSRSRSLFSIVEEVCDLVTSGHREIVLTGVNVGDFDDNGCTLADLVRAIDQNPGVERLRISSINPNEVSDDLIEALLTGRSTCPSMHLVLQSGSSSVLKRMRRPYDRDLFFRIVDTLRARNPDFTFTTDVIVGFPGETEADFEDSLETIRQVKFAKVHMFPYSRRPGTLASRLTEIVPLAVIKQRKNQVLRLSEEIACSWRDRFIGQTLQVLTEDGPAFGQTIHGIGVCIPKQVEELDLGLSQSSRDSTIKNGSIFKYEPVFDRVNPEALAKSKFQFFNLFGHVEGEKIQPNTLLDVRIIGNSPLGLVGALTWVDS